MNPEQPEANEHLDASKAPAADKNRQWPFLLAVGAIITAAVVTALISCHRNGIPGKAGSPSATASPSTPPTGIPGEASMTGPALLRHLAAHVGETAGDRSSGIYTHITIVEWARGTAEITRQRLDSWHTADGRLRVDSRAELPPVPAAGFDITTVEPAALLAALPAETSANDVKRNDVDLPAGANPLQELTVALQKGQPDWLTATASVRIDTITNLYRQQYLHPQLRTAALQLLADQGEFTHHRVTDRAKRSGIAFTLADDGARWTLVIDPSSGQLLAYERWTVAGNKLDTYALILTIERTDRTPSPASPTPASNIIPTAPPTQRAPA